jgi:phosphoribosyl-ATP pyrophosphohydrolase/phosphoribosyl-AMP cyclohydrolase
MRKVSLKRLSYLKYNENGLIPAIVQDVKTKKVLMLAYMNKESLKITLREKRTCFYSRSRKTLWRKGETSGNIQKVKEIYYDCDKDALLIEVEQVGVACHTKNFSCFYRKIKL